MTPVNVCYVLACKEDGIYVPLDDVYQDLETAVHEAAALLDEDPACDPRLVQVLLDPQHPRVTLTMAADEIEDLARRAEGGAYQDGILRAVAALRQAGTAGMESIDELGEEIAGDASLLLDEEEEDASECD